MPVDAFSFTMTAPRNSHILNFDQLFDMCRPFSQVEIYVNECLRMLGRIDVLEIGGDGSVITIKGRDYLANLIESFSEISSRVSTGMTLEQALENILMPFGVAEIVDGNDDFRAVQLGVPNDASDVSLPGTKSFNKGKRTITETTTVAVVKDGELVDQTQSTTRTVSDAIIQDGKPEPNEKVWNTMEKFVARKHFTIQPTSQRYQIALAVPDYNQPSAFTFIRHLDGSGNNIIGGSVTRDYSRVPTYTEAYGKYGPASSKKSNGKFAVSTFGDNAISPLGKNPEVRAIVSGQTIDTHYVPSVVVKDNNGLLYRPLFLHDTEAKSQDEFENSARRSVSEVLKETLQIEYELAGHLSNDGLTYTGDCMCTVDDEMAKVSEPMWISGVTFSMSTSGTTTKVRMWRPDSFIL